MSKKNRRNGESTETGEALDPTGENAAEQPVQVPEGYEEQSSDLVGFWQPDKGPVHFIPLYARAFDNGVEASKPSILIIGQSVMSNSTLVDGEGAPVTSQSGELIGVWYKPGMNAVAKLANVRVYIQKTGERDTGKPNPMTTFSVSKPQNAHGNELFVTDDFRKKSKHAELPIRLKNAVRRAPVSDADEDFQDRF